MTGGCPIEYRRNRAEYTLVNEDDVTTPATNAALTGDAGEGAATVQSFVCALMERYRSLRDAGATSLPDADATDRRLSELLLAEAALRYRLPAVGDREGRPPQIAVLGPTQTGKSTIVNLIVGVPAAEVSPLAGFTIYPQGFWIGPEQPDDGWTARLFPGWQRCVPQELSRDESKLERFALGPLPDRAQPPAGLPACVVWDTPDFDSLAAQTYRRGVLEVAALADVHVFVLSKEKYCDLSVWRMLRLLGPLGRPLIVCVNKLTPDAIEPVINSLKERLADAGGHVAGAPVMVFEYQVAFDATADLGTLPEVWDLRDHIAECLDATSAGRRRAGVQAFVRRHWPEWIAPVEVEHAAARAFDERVVALLAEASESYRRDFLDHPQRFDTFRRATFELLHLLELPGVANVLSQARQVLSWPARRLFAAGRAWSARRRKNAGMPHGAGSEEVVLYQIIERLLTGLERDAARRCDPKMPGHAVWRALAKRLEQHDARLRARFQAAAQQQREEFAPVIQATANQLYETLQNRPAMLNTLRAARATTDVAAIALAIKTGGLGLNDLLFAPAMFALVSMLTEGALGTYMTRIAKDLKKRQLEHVESTLIKGVFAEELDELAVDLKDTDLFGVAPEQLRVATAALEAWEQSEDE
jgi:hypothetical protein